MSCLNRNVSCLVIGYLILVPSTESCSQSEVSSVSVFDDEIGNYINVFYIITYEAVSSLCIISMTVMISLKGIIIWNLKSWKLLWNAVKASCVCAFTQKPKNMSCIYDDWIHSSIYMYNTVKTMNYYYIQFQLVLLCT